MIKIFDNIRLMKENKALKKRVREQTDVIAGLTKTMNEELYKFNKKLAEKNDIIHDLIQMQMVEITTDNQGNIREYVRKDSAGFHIEKKGE